MRAWLILGLVLCGTPAWSRPASTLPRRLAACAAVGDDLRRLNCFDRLAAEGGFNRLRYVAPRPRTRMRAAPGKDACFTFNGERVCA